MAAAPHACDVGASIRALRRSLGLTQAELAARAGVGRQWLVAVERGHERAEIGKVAAVLAALGHTFAIHRAPDPPAPRRTWLTTGDVAEAIRDDLDANDTDFALRTLGRAVADFRRLIDPDDVATFLAEPPSTGDHRWDTLVAATISRECRLAGIEAPSWTKTVPLASWWFPVFDPILTARTMQRTPVDFSTRGIWLDSRALEVV
jgi:y4mF family transcriptional regulator